MNKTIHGIHKSVSFTVFTRTPLRGLNSKQFHAFHNIIVLNGQVRLNERKYENESKNERERERAGAGGGGRWKEKQQCPTAIYIHIDTK